MTKLLVRISDNVLDEDDWPVRRIEIQGEVIVSVEDIHQGVYAMDEMPDKGWDLDRLITWSSYDGTGTHPENFYEVKAQTDDRYHLVWDRPSLNEVMWRAKREVAPAWSGPHDGDLWTEDETREN